MRKHWFWTAPTDMYRTFHPKQHLDSKTNIKWKYNIPKLIEKFIVKTYPKRRSQRTQCLYLKKLESEEQNKGKVSRKMR